MEWSSRIWRWAKNSQTLAVIALALEIAKYLEKYQFILDFLEWVLQKTNGVGLLHSVLVGLGETIHRAIQWWRTVVEPIWRLAEQFIGFQIPAAVEDFCSIMFFSYMRYRALAAQAREIESKQARLRESHNRSVGQMKRRDRENGPRDPEVYEGKEAKFATSLDELTHRRAMILRRAIFVGAGVFLALWMLRLADSLYVSYIRASL